MVVGRKVCRAGRPSQGVGQVAVAVNSRSLPGVQHLRRLLTETAHHIYVVLVVPAVPKLNLPVALKFFRLMYETTRPCPVVGVASVIETPSVESRIPNGWCSKPPVLPPL